MPFDVNQFMANPWTNIGLGILSANKPGASFGQAVGGGMLGGIQNLQIMREEAEKAKERELRREWMAEAGFSPGMPQWAAEQAFAAQYPKPQQFGTTVQYVADKKTGQILPAQASQSGGVFITNPDGTRTPFDPMRHELQRPYSPLDIGGQIVPFQPLGGQIGAAGVYAPQRYPSPYLTEDEANMLHPDSQLVPGPDGMLYRNPRASAGGIQKTLPPEARPEIKGAQTTAVKEAEEAVKKKSNFGKVRSSLNTFERQTNVARQNIKDIINMYGDWTAWTPDFIANLPMSKARAIQNKLNTVKGNVGFQALQEMRSNSPTGGALGQVAVQELETLQGVLGTMDWRDREFIPTLQRMDEILAGMANTARSAFEQDYGTGNSVDNLLKKYGVQ